MLCEAVSLTIKKTCVVAFDSKSPNVTSLLAASKGYFKLYSSVISSCIQLTSFGPYYVTSGSVFFSTDRVTS